MGNGATTDVKVPNPAYQALQRLRAEIQQAAPALRAALDRPAQDMGSGRVWVGPKADAFMQEVTGRKQRLATLVEALLADVDAELRATPQECTSQEASTYRYARRGNI
jgi:uncharacterized protein YukE